MLGTLLCAIIGHKINRHRVWHDGRDFRSRCRRCKSDMIRTREGWERFRPDIHGTDRKMEHHEGEG